MTSPYASFLALANTMADDARRIALHYFRTPVENTLKPDLSPVSQADQAIEAAWRKRIAETFPEHGILGEETGQTKTDAEYVWVLDPIDGTRAFLAGMPTFGCLIALCHKGVPVLGLIEHPATKDRLIGLSGEASTLNDKPIKTRSCETSSDATFSTTSPFLFARHMHGLIRGIMSNMKNNVLGKDCMAYSMLASGHVDAVIEAGLKPYDFCALVPVIQGAGGIITDWQNQPLTLQSDGKVIVCGSAGLHTELQPQLANF